MIVRDSRSPRGRIEELPRSPFDVVAGIEALALYGGGLSWFESDEVIERRIGEGKRSVVRTTTRSTHTLACVLADCGKQFTTTNPQRRYCSARCSRRLYARRNRAAINEAKRRARR